MFNYEIDPQVLAPHVPRGTELDTWSGRAYVSIVAFQFLDTRVLGIPIPFHRDFEELNLRFYVRRLAGGEVRRAVVFIRELVPRHAIALLAKAVYNEPYSAAPMKSRITFAPLLEAGYAWWLKRRWHRCEARATGEAALPLRGSLEEFISEHYWGYTRQRDGSTIEYRVAHPQWTVSPGDYRIDADWGALYGPVFAPFLATPVSVFLADGSPVTVFRPTRVA